MIVVGVIILLTMIVSLFLNLMFYLWLKELLTRTLESVSWLAQELTAWTSKS